VGKVSPWIEPDAPSVPLRRDSEAALRQVRRALRSLLFPQGDARTPGLNAEAIFLHDEPVALRLC